MSAAGLVVVGAGGTQAGALLRALRRDGPLDGVVAVDRHWAPERERAARDLGARVETLDVVEERARTLELLGGARLVANLAGPFFALGTRVLDLAVEAGVDYLDICDDVDVTEALLARDEPARAAGVRALVGMGSSPGTTNVLVRLASDALGEPAYTEAELAWSVDGEDMTPAAFGHMVHCFATALPGEKRVPEWEELSPRRVVFPDPVGAVTVVTLGHPEPLTLPHFLGLRRVTNQGGVAPGEILHTSWALARLVAAGGGEDREALAEAYALAERTFSLARSRPGHARTGSGMQIDVVLEGSGLRFASGSHQEMEEATGIPAAAGVLMMLDASGPPPGVCAPECLVPRAFFEALRRVSGGGGGLHLLELRDGRPGRRLRIRDLLD